MRRYGLVIAGLAAISSCYVATHYEGWQYRGGRLVNNGLFTRPRFEAQFPAIPLNVARRYEYAFSRFPASDAVVMLTASSAVQPGLLERLTTTVRLRVVDQRNQVVCDATGSPAGDGDRQLVITSSDRVIGLWHLKCARLQLRTCEPCRLEISIGPVDAATPAVFVVPTLRGGGIELP